MAPVFDPGVREGVFDRYALYRPCDDYERGYRCGMLVSLLATGPVLERTVRDGRVHVGPDDLIAVEYIAYLRLCSGRLIRCDRPRYEYDQAAGTYWNEWKQHGLHPYGGLYYRVFRAQRVRYEPFRVQASALTLLKEDAPNLIATGDSVTLAFYHPP